MDTNEDFQAAPLDEVLGETEAPEAEAVTAEPAPEPEVEPTGEPNEPAEPDPATPPVAAEPEANQVPIAALQAERQQRQELERRLQAFEQQQAQQPQQPQDDNDDLWWEDPKAAATEALQQQQQHFQHQLYQTRLGMDEAHMRQSHDDYDSVVDTVVQAAEADPNGPLAMQIYNSPTPATTAYELAKQMKMVQEIGSDPAAYKAKLREEVLAEMGANKAPESLSPVASAPKSLASVPSAPAAQAARWEGPAPLESILDD